MHYMYCGMPNSTSWAEATLNSEKNQGRSLTSYACLKASVSYLVSYLLNFFFKFHSNLLKAFRVDLKACLVLGLPNQYYLIIIWENEAGFCVMFFHGPHLLLCGPYYTI